MTGRCPRPADSRPAAPASSIRSMQRLGRETHPVMLLVAGAHARQDLHRLFDRRLADVDLLEAALERAIVLDRGLVLRERGRADAPQADGQGRLEQVRRVLCAVARGASADDHVDLVDEEDRLGIVLDRRNDARQALFELAPQRGARQQAPEIESVDSRLAQLRRDPAARDRQRQPFDDGGLARAGVADQNGVVLAPAAQDMNHPVQLGVAADERIDLAAPCAPSQVGQVRRQHVAGVLVILGLGTGLPGVRQGAGPRSRRQGPGPKADGDRQQPAAGRWAGGRARSAAAPPAPGPRRPSGDGFVRADIAAEGRRQRQVERRIGPPSQRTGQRALEERRSQAVGPVLEGAAPRLCGLAIGRDGRSAAHGKEDDSAFASSVRALLAVARAREDVSVRLQHDVRIGTDELHHGRKGPSSGRKAGKPTAGSSCRGARRCVCSGPVRGCSRPAPSPK
jgi:hypothetical protein